MADSARKIYKKYNSCIVSSNYANGTCFRVVFGYCINFYLFINIFDVRLGKVSIKRFIYKMLT